MGKERKEKGRKMKKNLCKGKFVVVEGPEGSGKSEQTALLARALRKEGCEIMETAEPTHGLFGKLVRALYGNHPDAKRSETVRTFFSDPAYRTMKDCMEYRHPIPEFHTLQAIGGEIAKGSFVRLPLFLQIGMMLDRFHHRIQQEIPQLERGITVISDRDFPSTLCYGKAAGLDYELLLRMHESILGERFILPDIIFLITVPVEVGIARTLAKQNGKQELHDHAEFQRLVQKAYRVFAGDPRFSPYTKIVEVDGTGPIEDVHKTILRHAEQSLNPELAVKTLA